MGIPIKDSLMEAKGSPSCSGLPTFIREIGVKSELDRGTGGGKA
jgi:hypothetical protein